MSTSCSKVASELLSKSPASCKTLSCSELDSCPVSLFLCFLTFFDFFLFYSSPIFAVVYGISLDILDGISFGSIFITTGATVVFFFCPSLSFVILGTAPILLFSGGLRSAVVTEMVCSSFVILVEFVDFLMEPVVFIY